MLKLLGPLLVASLCTGCFSQARQAHVVDAPDPIVGDLRCAAPRISLLEALYYGPYAPAPSEQCEAHEI